MSRNWERGSTRRWRRIRAAVLARDHYRCRLRLPGCTTAATQVHHTLGRHVTGDDPAHLMAVCASCNRSTGSPAGDPSPKFVTRWYE